MINAEYNVKTQFYRALQALDLYMKEFTVAIAKDPDAVGDIKKIFDGTQVIARWFSEETGDAICRAFEQSDTVDWTVNSTDSKTNGSRDALSGEMKRHYYENVGSQFGTREDVDVGVPGMSTGYKKASEQVKKAYENFQALKNLINAFARIGDKFGGQALHTKVFMSPAQIYKALLDYLKQSAISINRTAAGDRKNVETTPAAVVDYAIAHNVAESATPSFVGVAKLSTMLGDETADTKFGAGPYQMFFSSVGLFDNYKKEREMFATAIKAMASKVLTVIGVYDMFERTAPLYQLTPVRMIVGGADGGAAADVAIEPAAAELYYRLPLLAEFYYELLNFDETRTTSKPGVNAMLEPQIALLADFEGVFAGLIQFMFLKVRGRSEYSDEEVRALVREVNAIHAHYAQSHPEGTTAAALTGFVAEINRRYGLVKKDDYSALQEAVARGKQLETIVATNIETNYSILPGEDDLIDRPAPNVYFPKGWEKSEAVDAFEGRADLRRQKWALLEFRKRLDTLFKTSSGTFLNASSTEKLAQARGELARAPTPAARFTIVSNLIRGDASSVDSSVAFMFHETVVVGLNTLSAIKTMLDQFKEELSFMDPCKIESAIMDAFFRKNARGLGGAALADITDHASLVAVMNAMRAIGNVPVTGPIGASPDGCTELTEAFGSDLLMRKYMLSAADTLDMRSGLPQTAAAITGGGVCTNATTAGGQNHQLAAGTINANGPQNWTKQPSTYTDTYVNGAFAKLGGTAQDANTDQTMKALKVVARLLVNYPEIMYRFLESLFAISADGLVDVSISKSGVRIDFTKLQSMVDELFADVKYYFELLRPNLSTATVEKYMAAANQGSIEWVDKNLIDAYFRSTDIAGKSQSGSIQGITADVSKVFKNLTRNTGVNFNTVAAAPAIQAAAANTFVDEATYNLAAEVAKSSAYEWYGSTFARIGWYDATAPDSGVVTATANVALADGTDEFGGLVATACAERNALMKHPRINPAGIAADTVFFPLYGSDDKTVKLANNSIMFSYNRLVARYLITLLDSAAGNKIYLNLVNAFVNGVASASVSDPGSFAHPDIVAAAATNFHQRGDPKPNAVLLASIAWALQRIRNDSNPTTNIADHLVTTLTDVPLYIKEAMRANLPSFVRLFDLVAKKCDFIKQVMQKTEAKTNRPNLQTIAGNNANAGDVIRAIGANAPAANTYPNGKLPTSIELLAFDGATEAGARALKVRFAAIFDALASGALTLSSAASETLKELGDSAVYLQTGEGAIEQYTMRFGKAPLMPLSLALYMLRNNAGDSSPIELAFPRHTLGTPNFKLMYGLRAIVAPSGSAALSYDQLPGVQTALALYNGSASRTKSVVDPARYLQFANMTAGAIRWITDARCYKGMLSAERSIRETVLVNPAQAGANLTVAELTAVAPAAAVAAAAAAAAFQQSVLSQYKYSTNGITLSSNPQLKRFAAYSLGDASIEGTISIIESSDQESSLSDIADTVVTSANAPGGPDARRKSARIQNLIDMNIIPINVHAMMRGVPLANLYNYEYTFEQFACQMMGERTECLTLPTAKNATQEFLKLLKNPYKDVDAAEYGSDCTNAGSEGFIHRIFRGDNGLGMGRPKFLSDQIFNKPLFGSVYQSRHDWDEAGPITGIGKARGIASVLRVAHTFNGIKNRMAPYYQQYIDVVGNPQGLAALVAAIAVINGAVADTAAATATATVLAPGPAPLAANTYIVGQEGKDAAECVRILVKTLLYIQSILAAIAVGGAAATLRAVLTGLAATEVNTLPPLEVALKALATAAPAVGAVAPTVAECATAGINLDTILTYTVRQFGARKAAACIADATIVNNIAYGGNVIADVNWAVAAPTYALIAPRLAALAPITGNVAITAAINLIDTDNEYLQGAIDNGILADANLAPGVAFAPVALAGATEPNTKARVLACVKEAVVHKLCSGANSWAQHFLVAYSQSQTELVELLMQLPSSTALADTGMKNANDVLKFNLVRAATINPILFAGTGALVNTVIVARDAIHNGGGARGLVTIPQPAAVDAFVTQKRNPTMMVVAYVLARFFDQPNANVANGTTMLQRVASLIEIRTVAAAGVPAVGLAAAARNGPYTNNAGAIMPNLVNNLDLIAAKLRVEFVDSTGVTAAAVVAVGPLAVPIAEPLYTRDAADRRIANDQRIEQPLRTAARAGTASLTWLGAEVPAEDDSQNPKATQDYEAIHKVKLFNSTTKRRLESIGLARFNSHFVRDLFFITNVTRLVRLKLNRELTHSRGVLRASHMAVAPDVTEYGMDPFGANSVFESNTRATYDRESKEVIGNPRWDDGPDNGAYMRKTF